MKAHPPPEENADVLSHPYALLGADRARHAPMMPIRDEFGRAMLRLVERMASDQRGTLAE
jgi:hypothetical protein